MKTVGDGGACFIKPNGDIVEISQADLSPETIITTAEDFALELDADRLVIPLKESTLGWLSKRFNQGRGRYRVKLDALLKMHGHKWTVAR